MNGTVLRQGKRRLCGCRLLVVLVEFRLDLCYPLEQLVNYGLAVLAKVGLDGLGLLVELALGGVVVSGVLLFNRLELALDLCLVGLYLLGSLAPRILDSLSAVISRLLYDLGGLLLGV